MARGTVIARFDLIGPLEWTNINNWSLQKKKKKKKKKKKIHTPPSRAAGHLQNQINISFFFHFPFELKSENDNYNK